MAATNAMRDQTMEEILASIHRMIADGETSAADPSAVPEADDDEADADEQAAAPNGDVAVAPGAESDAVPHALDADVDWITAGVAAILEGSRASTASPIVPEERALAAGRGFVSGFAAGAEDVALVEASETKLETSMTEQQRAASAAPAPSRPALSPRAEAPSAKPATSDTLEERILSEAANASVSSSFDHLSRTVLSQNPRTLEDLVRDLMRPMLRSWLDQNLPRITERMVKQEIERIARGER